MEEIKREDPELQLLLANKQDGYEYRRRREEDWRQNYTLYRNRVQYNRLTQRQTVTLPLMKQTIRTLMKDIDDMPALYFENLDNDKQAEVFKNAYWEQTVKENNMSLQDIVDKKQVLNFGRSYDQWQIKDGKVVMTVQDPEDILVSRYTDPFNIHSSRYLVHVHIFEPLSVLEANPDYDKQALKELREWFASDEGIVKSATNQESLRQKNQKMADMGDTDVEDPLLGETYVELSLHFVYHKEEEDEEEQLYQYVEAEDMKILMKKPLEQVIGVTKDYFWRNHYPYNSWADDLERQDWYSDAVADVVRPSAVVLNTWWSQLVENRTMRSLGMHYYDSGLEGFQPNTFELRAWGWYGVPVPAGGKIADVLQKIDIPDLSESLDELTFLLNMNDRSTGATATQQGVQTERQITLGEIKFALNEAKERVKGMSKFYIPAWEQRGLLFIKLLEAAPDKIDAVRIFKKGRNSDNIYSREISPDDWRAELGYRCKVWSQDEKNAADIEGLQKMNMVKTSMPDNPKVDEVYKRRLVEFGGFTPEEANEAMEFEKQKREAMLAAMAASQVPGQILPGQPQVMQQLPAPAQPAVQ